MGNKESSPPSFRFSTTRTEGSRRVRYSEGNHINTEECLLCVPTDDHPRATPDVAADRNLTEGLNCFDLLFEQETQADPHGNAGTNITYRISGFRGGG